MKKIILAAVMMIALTNESKAEFVNAEMLAALCNYKSLPQQYQKFAKDSCNGTIRSYLEYNSAMKTHFKLKVPFCLSGGGATLSGATSTFIGYLQQNPQHKIKPAAIVFAEAMASVSKCK